MTLRTNAVLTFDSYEIGDDGVRLRFLCADPGPGQDSYYEVTVTFAEITAGTPADFRDLVATKLRRKLRATGLATRLDSLLGSQITV